MVFQDLILTPAQVAHRIILEMDTNKIIPKMQFDRILLMSGIDNEKPWGFFNSASNGVPGICDVGSILLLRFKSLFSFRVRFWKDNRVELYALWVLLKAAEERGLEHFQVFGDSKLMRDWTN